MSEALIIALVELTLKYGPALASSFVKLYKGTGTLDEAITALDAAAKKSADDYLAAAKAAAATAPAGTVTVITPG